MGLKEFVLDRERRIARKEAHAEIIEEKELVVTQNLITQTDLSDEKIASIVGVGIAFVKEMRTSL